MIACCSSSLFRLKFMLVTPSTARMPPFLSTTVSCLISGIGRYRCTAVSSFFFPPRTEFFLAGFFCSSLIELGEDCRHSFREDQQRSEVISFSPPHREAYSIHRVCWGSS